MFFQLHRYRANLRDGSTCTDSRSSVAARDTGALVWINFLGDLQTSTQRNRARALPSEDSARVWRFAGALSCLGESIAVDDLDAA